MISHSTRQKRRHQAAEARATYTRNLPRRLAEIVVTATTYRGMGLEEITSRIAAALKADKPTKILGVAFGVRDHTYSTVANGWVMDYRGEAIVTMANGTRWKAIGHGPKGNAYTINKDGWIEFQPA